MSFGIYFINWIINTYYKRTEYSNNIYSSNFLCYAVCESMTKNRNKGDELSTKINGELIHLKRSEYCEEKVG